MAYLLKFLKQQFGALPSVDSFKCDLSEKTVIVVGSNAGLGLEATKHLATMMGGAEDGGRLILACRNIQKGDEALKSIQASTGFSRMEVWEVDLANFSSIKAFADRFENEGGGRLDLLVMNSGVTTGEFKKTADGWETQLQVNYIGTGYLALRLIPSLSKAERVNPCPRLVIVSSDMHYVAPKIVQNDHILDDLNDENLSQKTMRSRYALTKLLSVMFVRALAAHLPDSSPIEVDAANPGLCKSSLREGLKTDRIVHVAASVLAFLFARSSEEGGRSIAYAAVARPSSKEGDEKPFNGKFISTCKEQAVSAYALSQEGKKVEDQIWTELIDILTRVDEKIPNIVSVYLK